MHTLAPTSPGLVQKRRRFGGRQVYLLTVVLLGLAAFGAVALVWSTVLPRQAFLVAARRLPTGTQLTTADLTTIEVDPAVVPAGAVQQMDAVVGQTVAETLEAGDYVTPAHLANAPGRLATGLADDQRLITIPTNGATALVEGFQPGDRFDLLLSLPTPAAGSTLSGALVEGLVLRSINSAGDFEVAVPLTVAVFIAQTEAGGKLSIFASPATAVGSGVPILMTGQICEILLAPDGSLVPATAYPVGATPCPGIEPAGTTSATTLV